MTPTQSDRPSPAEKVVYDRLCWMGCAAPVDPYDPDDCASVAAEVVLALSEAGMLAEGTAHAYT